MCKPGILLPFNSPLRRVTSVFPVTKASISVFPNCSLCGKNFAVTVSSIFSIWPRCRRIPVFNFAQLPYCWWWLILRHISPRQPSRAQHFPCLPSQRDSQLAQKDQALQKEAKGADMDHKLGAAWDGPRKVLWWTALSNICSCVLEAARWMWPLPPLQLERSLVEFWRIESNLISD